MQHTSKIALQEKPFDNSLNSNAVGSSSEQAANLAEHTKLGPVNRSDQLPINDNNLAEDTYITTVT